MSDLLFIKQLRFAASIGCEESELTQQQSILLDVTLHCDCVAAAHSDDLADASVNYAQVALDLQKIAQAKHYHLVEHLAETLCQHVLTHYAVSAIELTLTKPEALPHAAGVGITVQRQSPS